MTRNSLVAVEGQLLAVVTARLSVRGVLLEANVGFLRPFGDGTQHGIGDNAEQFFVQPSFAAIVAATSDMPGGEYIGLMTIGDPLGKTWTVRGRMWRDGTQMLMLAEFDIVELERVTDTVLEINRELNTSRHALARVNLALKQAQRALLDTNTELLRSNEDLKQFAYAASHDLREPLRSVASSVQLLQMRYAGQLDARADEFIAHAVNGATRMQGLIDDLLAFSRVGNKSNPATHISMESALTAAIANLQVAIAESSAQITHDPLPQIHAQGTQITMLLQNLLANAIKFRGDKPAVVHVGARQDGDEWILSVADQGIGIDPKYFNRIFELFKRLHTREEYTGTGIGLALCKKIVERHGGRIWVESVSGKGTTLFFTLPSSIPSELLVLGVAHAHTQQRK